MCVDWHYAQSLLLCKFSKSAKQKKELVYSISSYYLLWISQYARLMGYRQKNISCLSVISISCRENCCVKKKGPAIMCYNQALVQCAQDVRTTETELKRAAKQRDQLPTEQMSLDLELRRPLLKAGNVKIAWFALGCARTCHGLSEGCREVQVHRTPDEKAWKKCRKQIRKGRGWSCKTL